MTQATELVNIFMQTLETKDHDRAASYLADDFLLNGFTPKPLGKDEFMTLMSGLQEGMPNLSYHLQDVKEVEERSEGNRVEGNVHITGVQTETFIVPPLGLPPIPQTAKPVSLPSEVWTFVVRNGAIHAIHTSKVPGGDIKGLLNQLGINVPIIQ